MFEVIGNHPVAGVDPGGTVVLDLPQANIDALVRSGHIAPAEKTCGGTTVSGKPCSKPAGDGGFCHLHSEDDA